MPSILDRLDELERKGTGTEAIAAIVQCNALRSLIEVARAAEAYWSGQMRAAEYKRTVWVALAPLLAEDKQ